MLGSHLHQHIVLRDATILGTALRDDLSLWAMDLMPNRTAVTLYNPKEGSRSLSVSFATLGWRNDTRASVFDPMKRLEMGTFDGQLSYELRGRRTAENSYVAKLTPLSAGPA